MAEPVALRYRAFISYSHADTAWAKWLHRALAALRTMMAVTVALLAWPGAAGAEPVVHDGMTKAQLGEFAERQGWQAELSTLSNDATIHVGDRKVHITMTDCGAGGVCLSGLIREQTYYFIKSESVACTLWHWNMDAKGATGIGPQYVTLQRYLNFRGVTDQYLKDSIDAYLAAAPSFWELVEACAKDRQQSAE